MIFTDKYSTQIDMRALYILHPTTDKPSIHSPNVMHYDAKSLHVDLKVVTVKCP